MTAHILIAALEVAHEHVVEAKNYFVPFIDFNTQILNVNQRGRDDSCINNGDLVRCLIVSQGNYSLNLRLASVKTVITLRCNHFPLWNFHNGKCVINWKLTETRLRVRASTEKKVRIEFPIFAKENRPEYQRP